MKKIEKYEEDFYSMEYKLIPKIISKKNKEKHMNFQIILMLKLSINKFQFIKY